MEKVGNIIRVDVMDPLPLRQAISHAPTFWNVLGSFREVPVVRWGHCKHIIFVWKGAASHVKAAPEQTQKEDVG
jgi:hypothetical protein